MAKAQRKAKSVEQVVEVAPIVTEATKGKKQVQPIVLSKSQEAMLSECTTISAKIRYLNLEGFDNSQISKFLNKRYQHVRNVLTTPMKRKVKEDTAVSAATA
jgi:hypothetical protein